MHETFLVLIPPPQLPLEDVDDICCWRGSLFLPGGGDGVFSIKTLHSLHSEATNLYLELSKE